mmetsp:Transcript_53282/g.121335  ORF Transcript_53282/g.121335 Transcript_53282/m.121335 type:complete len:467 (+) Transcript_53282:37-1437(+)
MTMGRGRRRPPLKSVLQFEVSGDDPWGQDEDWIAASRGGYRGSKVAVADPTDLRDSDVLENLKLAKCGHSQSVPDLRRGDLRPLSRLRRVGPTWHGVIESERSPALGPVRARLQEKFSLAWDPPPGAQSASEDPPGSPVVVVESTTPSPSGAAAATVLPLPADGEEESVDGDMLVRSPVVRVERRSATPQATKPKVTLQVSPPRTPAPPAAVLEDWQLPLPALDHPGSLVLRVVGLGGTNKAYLPGAKAAVRGASATGPARPGGVVEATVVVDSGVDSGEQEGGNGGTVVVTDSAERAVLSPQKAPRQLSTAPTGLRTAHGSKSTSILRREPCGAPRVGYKSASAPPRRRQRPRPPVATESGAHAQSFLNWMNRHSPPPMSPQLGPLQRGFCGNLRTLPNKTMHERKEADGDESWHPKASIPCSSPQDTVKRPRLGLWAAVAARAALTKSGLPGGRPCFTRRRLNE